MQELLKKYDGHAYERYNGVTGETLGVKDYCWGVATWSIAVNTIYGIQEDYRTIVIPPHAKGRRLKLGKLEVNYLTDTSVELITSFEREFRVVFPTQTGKIEVNCNGKRVKNISTSAAASEVKFTAMPGKTYVASKSRDIGHSGDSASSNFWDEIPVSPSTTVPGQITDDYWHGQFQRVNQEVARATDTELVFFGNSITWMWTLGSATGQDVWNKNYSAYHPINMGNSGDITPVMLHRVTSGNLDFAEGHQPKVAVLLCGTNNFVVTQSDGGDVKWDLGADCPPADVANGVRAIAQVFRRRLPQTRVILMGILPVSDKTKWARCQQVNAINSALNYDENEVVYLDLQDKFLQADGSINKELFTDGTHLTVGGYKVWAKSLDNLVTKMMKSDPINPVKIMLIGGSITEGANSGVSYRRYLDGMLRREGILIDFVGSRKSHNDNQTEPDSYQYDADHEGHWGKNSGWLAKNMPDLLNRDVPDVAVIHMGTEDIVSGSGTDGALTDTIIDNISSVIKSLRSKNKSVKIILAKIIPIQGQTDMVNLLNLKISGYIKANSTAQSPVVMADQHIGFDPSADMADNGILPNASGAKKMARVFADVIKEGKILDLEK
jgi:lysophospholipase L1-like esterase